MISKVFASIKIICVFWLFLSIIIPSVIFASGSMGNAIINNEREMFANSAVGSCPENHTGYCVPCNSKLLKQYQCREVYTEKLMFWSINSLFITSGLFKAPINEFRSLGYLVPAAFIFLTPYIIAVIAIFKFLRKKLKAMSENNSN